ncbi:hypothetical protein PYW07_007774 [Mythimna separata]|uniref:Tc1-like transposase DDE domain-containing protein n=1 Tax=Mythimna separata TaxID=271217 RepID=A0AAD7YRJ3_MYTSE|nr:hypothetical protein PYW07_007774 [Mythimna separata]
MSKRGTVLHGRAREIVCNVDKYFESEKQHHLELIQRLKAASILPGPDGNLSLTRETYAIILQTLQNTSKVAERVHLATGINKNTLTRIRREHRDAQASCSKVTTPKKKPRSKSVVCDNFEITALHNIINSIYTVRKEIPTLKKFFAVAKEDLEFPGSRTTLRRILVESLGYKFKKCQSNRLALIQRPNIKAWRTKYLRRIRQNDALAADKKPVIYLDETWIHSHYTVKKCWQSSTTTGVRKNDSAGRRWIIAHAGGENGFIDGALLMFKSKIKTGDYHDEMNGANFTKWINEKLLPNLPKNAIIVMDNAPYHSMEASKAPNMTSRKCEMQSWLKEKNIAYEECYTKAELYEIIQRHKPPKDYIIDKIFNENGFEVLRLPPYNCDLNPIEYIWHLVKRRVADKNVLQLESEIENITLQAIASITKDDWQKEVNHVKRIEEEYWNREIFEDNDSFRFIINTGESSSENDDDSSSDSYGEMSGIEELDSD